MLIFSNRRPQVLKDKKLVDIVIFLGMLSYAVAILLIIYFFDF